jgi:hypothetical protein
MTLLLLTQVKAGQALAAPQERPSAKRSILWGSESLSCPCRWIPVFESQKREFFEKSVESVKSVAFLF